MASLDNTTEATAITVTGGADELSNVLRDVHSKNLAAYSRLLKAEKSTDNKDKEQQQPFWDIVVITAGDHQQKHCYQRRVDQKLAEGAIPSRARYLVIQDPPKSKIGSGGSTCLVMKILQEKFPVDFLAQSDKPEGIQVLDLKLVLYLHLLESMPPGVFLTSADGIELFSSSTPFPKDPKPFTITALAHPSSTQIGSTHGVYLLHDPEGLISADRAQAPKDQAALLLKCREFLHKPSLETMRRTPKLIYSNKNNSVVSGEEVVYTDSCYYFDPHTANLMAQVYSSLSQECDLEAWADVLSFQHTSATSSTQESNQQQQPLKQALHDANVQLDVMVLNASKFYHLGTMQEFLFATCTDQAFMSELHIRNRHPGVAIISEEQPTNSSTKSILDQNKEELGQGTPSLWTPPLFIENCHISPTVGVGAGSLIVDTNLPANNVQELMLPEDTCMFTLQVQEHAFVTFTFSVNDDMKRAVSVTSNDGGKDELGGGVDNSLALLKRLRIFESVSVLEMMLSTASYNNSDHHDHIPPTSLIQDCGNTLSLWTAPIFEMAPTAHESTSFALNRLARVRKLQKGTGQEQQQPQVQQRPKATMLGWVSLKDAARIAREL
ncbi:hypothetical protein EC991_009892 [Linnemannia zychae]|nr:hypothetical protein EC991_009892 [Linnemannia zychae]